MQHGFSLVELSIVLVILGLMTGGILAGQSLIRASELRTVSTEYNRFQTALFSFRDKYLAMPGDTPNATRFFGRMTTDTACLFNAGTSVTTTGVCNGDGDGLIGTTFGGTGNINEAYQVWRHLMAAGLIEGNYTGRYITGDCDPVGDIVNCPNARLSGAQWDLRHRLSPWMGTEVAAYFSMGKSLSGGTTIPSSLGGVMTPAEVWNIDTKLDDSSPSLGTVHGRNAWPLCISGSGATAAYSLNLTDKNCYIEFSAKL